MGVTGLWKLLEPSGKPVPLETLENKVLAIDISIWLHQVVKGFQDSKGGTIPHAHLLGLFHRLCKLLFYRIKPVFVFDGGVPALKRQTIKKRHETKKQFLNTADRLQELLLEALAKEKVVQQVLGDSAPLLTKSPKKKVEEEQKPNRDDMFKLPPLESPPTTSLDDTFEEKKVSALNLHSVDVNSAAFKALPADKRYEILTDIKETRKQSSWGRLHELPVQSNDFANFQMARLLKRRQVQLSLEEAEKDMGGVTLSFSELEKMLTEEGVLAAASKDKGQRIANDNVTKFVFVRDLKKAFEEAKKTEAKDTGESGQSSSTSNSEPSELGTEFESDLQKAIAMSLEEDEPDEDEDEHGGVKMSEAQKKFLKGAAKSLARTYMMEFGGMSSEDVEELFKESEEESPTVEVTQIDFEAGQKKIPEEKIESISSDSDSDLEEVPMEENGSLEVVINPNEIKESLEDDLFSDIFAKEEEGVPVSETNSSEVVKNPEEIATSLKPLEIAQTEDPLEVKNTPEIVVDQKEVEKIFIAAKEAESLKIPDQDVKVSEETPEKEEETKIKLPIETQLDTQRRIREELRQQKEETKIKLPIETQLDTQKSILEELRQQKYSIPSITLDDLAVGQEDAIKEASQGIIEISDTEEEKTPTKPKKSLDDYFTVTPGRQKEKKDEQSDEDVPKVKSPFFVKKSPRSEKKSPGKLSSAEKKPIVAKELFPESGIKSQEPLELTEENREKLKEMREDFAKDAKQLETERNKQERLGVSITDKMSHECKELLRLFGIPYVVAPMEAEAQCAFMNAIQLTDGTITDDSDIWLFGGQTVYKNFFDQRKHVLEYKMEKIEKLFKVDRNKLIQMAMLVGSDYTIGINGIGAVTALEILAQFPGTESYDTDVARLSGLKSFKEWWYGSRHTSSKRSVLKGKLNNIVITDGFPSIQVLQAYLYPDVDDSKEAFVWGSPDVESIRELAKKKFGWPRSRTDELLDPVLKKLKDRKVQPSIKNYFNILTPHHTTEMKVSKRVRKAINSLSGETSAPSEAAEEEPKKPRKRATKKSENGKKEEKAPLKRRSTEPIPSTSRGIEKIPRIPNTKLKIPQREKDQKEAQDKMKKAIEVFKKKNA
ncbi:DNA excision repair protein ERCC-5 homolog [Phlebotomus papatasi]|uniref:DNA excision repair protein ERCC-5 homolog n=1 Tax=Phlebotomus papatasi TaxID=29031 RepID=UPI0024843F05|nr:DNA excision repair protein ERCC-5 homolog [Phlebotomus papatasi]